MHSLTEPELGIMQSLWEAGEAVPRNFVQKKLAHLNWKDTTFNTYLTRLQSKGFIRRETRGQTHYYKPAIPKNEYQQMESSSVLNKLFNGSVKNFVLSASHTDAVSKDDLDELRDFLNDLKGGGKDGE